MSEFINTIQPNEQLSMSHYVNLFYDNALTHNFAVLKLYVNPAFPDLVALYKAQIEKHNAQHTQTNYPNSGFDLFLPKTERFHTPFETEFVDLQVKAEMIFTDITMNHMKNIYPEILLPGDIHDIGGVCYSTGYYMYPRSSISKTPLMLANHTGIIDSGYRGNLIAAVRYLPSTGNNTYEAEKDTRLFQICHPQLCPIYVVLVDETQLSLTERGSGGFGSTGIKGV
jgi:dUTP pyrophosphatase